MNMHRFSCAATDLRKGWVFSVRSAQGSEGGIGREVFQYSVRVGNWHSWGRQAGVGGRYSLFPWIFFHILLFFKSIFTVICRGTTQIQIHCKNYLFLESLGMCDPSNRTSYITRGHLSWAVLLSLKVLKIASPKAFGRIPKKLGPFLSLSYQGRISNIQDFIELFLGHARQISSPILLPKLREGCVKWEIDLDSTSDLVVFCTRPFRTFNLKILVWIKSDGLNMCSIDRWKYL